MEKEILNYYQNFAKNIKIERLAKGMTQKQVAEKLGIKTQSYQAYENGLCMPTAENLLKLSIIFSCSLDELFEMKNS